MIPQWIAPAVVIGAAATVLIASPLARNEHHSDRALTTQEVAYMDQGWDGEVPPAARQDPSYWQVCSINHSRSHITCGTWSVSGRNLIPSYVK